MVTISAQEYLKLLQTAYKVREYNSKLKDTMRDLLDITGLVAQSDLGPSTNEVLLVANRLVGRYKDLPKKPE